MRKLIVLVILLWLSGCSNKAIYDNMLLHQRTECLKEPPPVYFECIKRFDKTYEEYEQERKEVLEHKVGSQGNPI